MTYSKATLWSESDISTAHMQAERLQCVANGPPGYRLRRIILTNFWLYEHQEFDIPHGRIFLAGDNASGKSTVLVAAVTLSLDGDIHPTRLDTFGKREKRIDYYIIGSNESSTPFVRDSRTSYVALEFEWCDMDQPPFASELRASWERGERTRARFLTIGLGFYGNRNSATPIAPPLRFLITDGTRLGSGELSTVTGKGENRRACDLKSFKKALAGRSIICETQREYEQKVSQYLFNFPSVDYLRRLIKQLLYLRQPDLSNILSLEGVRSYLNQSLPPLPGDLIQSAATTLELMDSLQDEIERRKKAYDAVGKLHLGQQIVITARARLAACEYANRQFKEDSARNEVLRLKRNITRAENESKRSQAQIDELETEQAQLTGKIAALEDNENLRNAHHISQVRLNQEQAAKSLHAQERIFEDTTRRREQIAQTLDGQIRAFQRQHQQSLLFLEAMLYTADQEAHWLLVVDQLNEGLQRLRQLTLDVTAPDIPMQISSLLDVAVQERLRWLQQLKKSHREMEKTSINLQSAQQQETKVFEELDVATRRFDEERDAFFSAHQDLIDRLDPLLDQSEQRAAFTLLNEQAALSWNAALPPQETLEQLGELLREYLHAIEQAITALSASIDTLQHEIVLMERRHALKQKDVTQAWERYEAKLREPEFVPARTDHRLRARTHLERQHVPAFPLYMLIDFSPEIDGRTPLAGRIERALEDAGLLDALIVPPAYSAHADQILATHGLSDCRLEFNNHHIQSNGAQPLLRVDPALSDLIDTTENASWQETTQTILQALTSTVLSSLHNDAAQNSSSQQQDASSWTHGLLSGVAGESAARCIGKATRLREQQEAQERLRRQWESLDRELQEIAEALTELQQRREQQQTLSADLQSVHKGSAIENQYRVLQTAYSALSGADQRYRAARNESATIRQRLNEMRMQLIKATTEEPIFASDALKVDQAYDATNRLAGDHRTFQSYQERLISAWQAHRQARDQLGDAKASEWRAEQAYRRAEQHEAQVRAELETLLQFAQTAATDIQTLHLQLRELQEQHNALPGEIEKAKEQKTRAETTRDNSQQEYTRAEETFQVSQQHRNHAYQFFLTQLDTYPVEFLIEKKQFLQTKGPLEMAQQVLDDPLESGDEAYFARKTGLEKHENTVRNNLFTLYNEVSNLLHEYGPQIDEQGIIRFLNMDRANAYELQAHLSQEIRHQEGLLEAQERELFQSFLLEELADSIREHILDAEAWVEKMNAVFSRSAFVGEYYRLKWVSRPQEQQRAGSQLAQYHDLLRRQAQVLKQEEIDALVHAFRQEIGQLRIYQQTASESTFAEALARVLDYRTWFQFEIYIIGQDGATQHLTNRFFKKRSGAEKYIALYIPFFAALSALYDNAGKGAPRLIALDEAFERVSVTNTRLLLNFLAAQQFQWLMAGTRITGDGTEIPSCVKYVMLCQKNQELATGFPAFWSTDLSLTEE